MATTTDRTHTYTQAPDILAAVQLADASLYDADTADLSGELPPIEVLVILPDGKYFIDFR